MNGIVARGTDSAKVIQENVKEMEATVAVSDGTYGSVERYHTEKELRDAVMPLLDERVISVDITKRAL